MFTIKGIANRRFSSIEQAKDHADKKGLDHSLISQNQDEWNELFSKQSVFTKENQASYLERHARMAN